eukprot:EG_transcript_4069
MSLRDGPRRVDSKTARFLRRPHDELRGLQGTSVRSVLSAMPMVQVSGGVLTAHRSWALPALGAMDLADTTPTAGAEGGPSKPRHSVSNDALWIRGGKNHGPPASMSDGRTFIGPPAPLTMPLGPVEEAQRSPAGAQDRFSKEPDPRRVLHSRGSPPSSPWGTVPSRASQPRQVASRLIQPAFVDQMKLLTRAHGGIWEQALGCVGGTSADPAVAAAAAEARMPSISGPPGATTLSPVARRPAPRELPDVDPPPRRPGSPARPGADRSLPAWAGNRRSEAEGRRTSSAPSRHELAGDDELQTEPRPQPTPCVVRRSSDEKRAHPERLNLDRRKLGSCPLLEGEQHLKLLNYQNNLISSISNLHSLPHLVFLDLYNNRIDAISGLDHVPTLRVLMLGKNNISRIANLHRVPRLDVLDLHNNFIATLENLDHLAELRVLNIAGNRLRELSNLSALVSLTELNARRNAIRRVQDLPMRSLQRLFLSNNRLKTLEAIEPCVRCGRLEELALDGNPLSAEPGYPAVVTRYLRGLRVLDMQAVEEAQLQLSGSVGCSESTSDPPVLCSSLSDEGDWAAPLATVDPETEPHLRSSSDLSAEASQASGLTMHFLGPDARSDFQCLEPDAVERVILEDVAVDRFSEFTARLCSLHNLRALTLSGNGVVALHQLAPLGRLRDLQHLTVIRNPILHTSAVIPSFCCSLLPNLQTFNGEEVTASQRCRAPSSGPESLVAGAVALHLGLHGPGSTETATLPPPAPP